MVARNPDVQRTEAAGLAFPTARVAIMGALKAEAVATRARKTAADFMVSILLLDVLT